MPRNIAMIPRLIYNGKDYNFLDKTVDDATIINSIFYNIVDVNFSNFLIDYIDKFEEELDIILSKTKISYGLTYHNTWTSAANGFLDLPYSEITSYFKGMGLHSTTIRKLSENNYNFLLNHIKSIGNWIRFDNSFGSQRIFIGLNCTMLDDIEYYIGLARIRLNATGVMARLVSVEHTFWFSRYTSEHFVI